MCSWCSLAFLNNIDISLYWITYTEYLIPEIKLYALLRQFSYGYNFRDPSCMTMSFVILVNIEFLSKLSEVSKEFQNKLASTNKQKFSYHEMNYKLLTVLVAIQRQRNFHFLKTVNELDEKYTRILFSWYHFLKLHALLNGQESIILRIDMFSRRAFVYFKQNWKAFSGKILKEFTCDLEFWLLYSTLASVLLFGTNGGFSNG